MAELPDQVVAGVELVVVELSAAARPAPSPYDAFRPASAVLDIGDASLVVATTSEPTYLPQGQSLALLPPPHTSLACQ
ncbi:hypothetical protein A2U01_0058686, partial [Trifolium medium]|nr:hypothetical protein [Trifolium medium]